MPIKNYEFENHFKQGLNLKRESMLEPAEQPDKMEVLPDLLIIEVDPLVPETKCMPNCEAVITVYPGNIVWMGRPASDFTFEKKREDLFVHEQERVGKLQIFFEMPAGYKVEKMGEIRARLSWESSVDQESDYEYNDSPNDFSFESPPPLSPKPVPALLKRMRESNSSEELPQLVEKIPMLKRRYTKREARMYQCPRCPRVYDRPWTFQNHMRIHTGEKPFTCPVDSCRKNFADRSNLVAHQRAKRHHNWTVVCKLCTKPFRHESSLYKHTKDACRKQLGKLRESDKFLYGDDDTVDALKSLKKTSRAVFQFTLSV